VAGDVHGASDVRAGAVAALPFPIHPRMWRHATGYKLANDGQNTRAIQHPFGHKNIVHRTRDTNLAADRFKTFLAGLSWPPRRCRRRPTPADGPPNGARGGLSLEAGRLLPTSERHDPVFSPATQWARRLLPSSAMRISRCAWHPRNFGHAKLLGIRWRGRGVAFTGGLCDKCAARIHPAVRPMVVRGVEVPKRGCTAIVVGVSAVMMTTGLVLVVWPISDVPPSEFPRYRVASQPREVPPPHVASPHQGTRQLRETPLRRRRSSTLPAPGRLAQATHPGSPASPGRVFLARTGRVMEVSTPWTGRGFDQSP
jgi:hypothetical protein